MVVRLFPLNLQRKVTKQYLKASSLENKYPLTKLFLQPRQLKLSTAPPMQSLYLHERQ